MALKLVGNINDQNPNQFGNLKKITNINQEPQSFGGLKLLGNIGEGPDIFKRAQEEKEKKERRELLELAHKRKMLEIESGKAPEAQMDVKGALFDVAQLSSAFDKIYNKAKNFAKEDNKGTKILEGIDAGANTLTFGARNLINDVTQSVHYNLFGAKDIDDLNQKTLNSRGNFAKQVIARDDLTSQEKEQLIKNANETNRIIQAGEIYDFAGKTGGQIVGEAVGTLADYLSFGVYSQALNKASGAAGKGILKTLLSKEGAKELAELSIKNGAYFGLGALGEGKQDKMDEQELADNIIKRSKEGAVAGPLAEVGGAAVFKLLGGLIRKSKVNSFLKSSKKRLGEITPEEKELVNSLKAKGAEDEVIEDSILREREITNDVYGSAEDYVDKRKVATPDTESETVKFREKEYLDETEYDALEEFWNDVRASETKGKNYDEALRIAKGKGVNIERQNSSIADDIEDLLEGTRKEMEIIKKNQAKYEATRAREANEAMRVARKAPTEKDFLIETKNIGIPKNELKMIFRDVQKGIDDEIIRGDYALTEGYQAAKFREDTFVGNFEKGTGKRLTEEQYSNLMKINKQIFGDEDLKITGQILANKKALGQYDKKVIKVVDGQVKPEDTLYHEAVHKYLDVFSTKAEYASALRNAKRKYNVEGDWAKVEEVLAEKFINYANTKKGDLADGMFRKTLNRMKSYFSEKDAVDNLYRDIFEGRAKRKAKAKMKSKTVSNGKESKLFQRIKGRLEDTYRDQEVLYGRKNIIGETKSAVDFIGKDPAMGMKIAKGLESTGDEAFDVSITIAMIEKAGMDGEGKLMSELLRTLSLKSTERGQANAMLKALQNNSPASYLKDAINAKLSSIKISKIDIKEAGTLQKAVMNKVKRETKEVKKALTGRQLNIQQAQDFINNLICK